MDANQAADACRRIEGNLGEVIVGKDDVCRTALVALLSGGHLLIEDVPGTGKTMLARAIARSLDATFKRVQFTPDLLPADVTGVSIWNQQAGEFEYRPGPIFTQILLADEINRATPRTQSALLEAMGERQVTAAGQTRAMDELFFVIATQNPVEQQGTFPLPEAQLDRFLIQTDIGYPETGDEVRILEDQQVRHPIETLEPVASVDEILELQRMAREVFVDEDVRRYVVELVRGTRSHREVLLGSSPRGSISLVRAAQARALIEGESFVRPAWVKELAVEVLAHRVIVEARSRLGGVSPEKVVEDVLDRVEVPVLQER